MSATSGTDDAGGHELAWDDLPLDSAPALAAGGSRRRPAWITAVAVVFVLNGISLSLYVGYLGAAPTWAPDPLPAIGVVTGLAAFAAAVGIFRQQAWGRWLGIALTVGWLARDAVLFDTWQRTGSWGMQPTGPSLLADILIPIGVNLVVLLLLVRRWPARG